MKEQNTMRIKEALIAPFIVDVWSTGYQVKQENANGNYENIGPVYNSAEQMVPFLIHQLMYNQSKELTILKYGQERKRLFKLIGEMFNGNDPGILEKMIQEVETEEVHSPESSNEQDVEIVKTEDQTL